MFYCKIMQVRENKITTGTVSTVHHQNDCSLKSWRGDNILRMIPFSTSWCTLDHGRCNECRCTLVRAMCYDALSPSAIGAVRRLKDYRLYSFFFSVVFFFKVQMTGAQNNLPPVNDTLRFVLKKKKMSISAFININQVPFQGLLSRAVSPSLPFLYPGSDSRP